MLERHFPFGLSLVVLSHSRYIRFFSTSRYLFKCSPKRWKPVKCISQILLTLWQSSGTKQTFTALLIALKSRVIVLEGKVACWFKSMYIIKGNHWEWHLWPRPHRNFATGLARLISDVLINLDSLRFYQEMIGWRWSLRCDECRQADNEAWRYGL